MLSEKLQALREEIVYLQTRDTALIGQYRYYYDKPLLTRPEDDTDPILLRAEALSSVIDHYPAVIFDDEQIVGNNFGCDNIMNAECSLLGWPEDRMKEYLSRGQLTAEQIEELIALYKGSRTMLDKAMPNQYFPPRLEDEKGVDGAIGFCLAHNHTIIGYERVLQEGFEGLLKEVQALRAGHEPALYDASEMILTSACRMGEHFAEKAEEMAAAAEGQRKAELLTIAETCRQVPRRPARTFREAVQSLWFAHIINTWEDYVNANSLGRIDQILYPYYKHDIEAGILTRDEAYEIICLFYLKLYRDYDVQQCTLGGCDREGNCAINDLSYLMLDAVEDLDFVRCMSVRLSSDMPEAFLRRSLEVVGRVAKGVPFFFSDDALIPALVRRGIPVEDARDYAPIGCVEICIPGKANAHAVCGRVNAIKALEYALTGGWSMFHEDLFCGLALPIPQTCDELEETVCRYLERLIDVHTAQVNRGILPTAEMSGMAYKSVLTQGCLESGRHFNAGGPIYNYYQTDFVALPNLADSLVAIRTLVEKEKRLTLSEMTQQLRDNFPDEALRQACVNAPKFGNDIPEVDQLCARLMNVMCDRLESTPSYWGEGFHAQPFSFVWMHDHGRHSAASADGRRKGEVLAYSISPMQGRDVSGLTAVLSSLCALPTHRAPGTASAIIEIDPSLLSEAHIDQVSAALRAAVKMGLSNIQFNNIKRETLIDAQVCPERHRNLAVRVSGFSQKFVLLDKAMQDHIIARTKHAR